MSADISRQIKDQSSSEPQKAALRLVLQTVQKLVTQNTTSGLVIDALRYSEKLREFRLE